MPECLINLSSMSIPSVTEQEILERVDEYSLYCFYLEFEPVIGVNYKSVLRDGDDQPSFGVFERTKARYDGGTFPNEYLWKDQGLGKRRNFGDLFDMVQILFDLPTRAHAVWKIASDFKIGTTESYELPKAFRKVEPVKTPPTRIRVQSRPFNARDLAYWSKYNVTTDILDRYNCTAVKYVFFSDDQLIPTSPLQAYAYRIHNRYQIYQPHAPREYKFRNDWTEFCVPGWQQLTGKELCINTKSCKDVMCLRSFGYDAVSPRSENILLPVEAVSAMKKRFKRIITLFDNDGKHSAHKYEFEQRFIPIESGTKDVSDFCAKYGPEKTAELLKQLL